MDMQKEVNRNPLTVDNLGRGKIRERFQSELSAALANIMDLATDPTKKRIFKLIFEITADADREKASMVVKSENKLVAPEPYQTEIVIDRTISGEPLAHEKMPIEIDFDLFKDVEEIIEEPEESEASNKNEVTEEDLSEI